MPDSYYFLAIHILLWSYVFFCLWTGRQTEYEVESSSSSFPVFLLMGFLLLYGRWNLTGVLSLLSCLLAGYLYKSIPSGFSQKAIYLRGRRILYKDIREWLVEEKGGKIRLSFYAKRKMALLITDSRHKEMILAYRSIWQHSGHQ